MTPEHPILGQVALGYSPMIDRNREVAAIRLSVFPLHADAALDASALVDALREVWPDDGAGGVSLNLLSEALLADLLRARPSARLMIEVPASVAAAPAHAVALRQLAADGNTLLLKGRPQQPLPRDVLPCFRWSIIDLADERRVGEAGTSPPPGIARSLAHVQSGVRARAARWRRASGAVPRRCSAGRSTTSATRAVRGPGRRAWPN